MPITLKHTIILVGFLGVTALAAATGATFKPGEWYMGLAKPGWTPPSSVFGPVWTVLYAMIAVAGWLAWRAGGWGRPLAFWIGQLVLNTLWSWAMFGDHRIDIAFVDIVALWLAIIGFIWAAWPISRTAALLFVPYLLWVSYAGALNFAIWRLNG